jgi:molybdopterin synthase catalytic subunit
MRVRVRLFARARDLVGSEAVDLDLAAGATAGDLRRRLAEARPALAGLLERSALAVNNEFADDSLTLPLSAEVALLPPVSGGARAE